MQCLGALQEAACSSCREMVTWAAAANVDIVALNKLNAYLHVPNDVLRERSNGKREAHRRRTNAIETRLQVGPSPGIALGPDGHAAVRGLIVMAPVCCIP